MSMQCDMADREVIVHSAMRLVLFKPYEAMRGCPARRTALLYRHPGRRSTLLRTLVRMLLLYL